jgi:predicted transcriptional regulator YdeE
LKDGATVFGVYRNYESDFAGEFDVMAGSDNIEESATSGLEDGLIQSGSYLLFEAKGDMPQVVVDTWSKIWAYFSSGDSEYQRTYTTDFELYKSQNVIEIYIAVKSVHN